MPEHQENDYYFGTDALDPSLNHIHNFPDINDQIRWTPFQRQALAIDNSGQIVNAELDEVLYRSTSEGSFATARIMTSEKAKLISKASTKINMGNMGVVEYNYSLVESIGWLQATRNINVRIGIERILDIRDGEENSIVYSRTPIGQQSLSIVPLGRKIEGIDGSSIYTKLAGAYQDYIQRLREDLGLLLPSDIYGADRCILNCISDGSGGLECELIIVNLENIIPITRGIPKTDEGFLLR